MRNLLEIEVQTLLENEVLQSGLQTAQIESFQNEIYTSGLSKFESSVSMSKVVAKSFEFFKESGKGLLEENGIYWGVDEFAQKMFGWKRSYLYKMVKLSKVHTSRIKRFKRDCQDIRESGEVVAVSVENCLKTIRESVQSGQDETPQTRPQIVLNIKLDGATFKMYDNTETKSSMSLEQLRNVRGILSDFIESLEVESAE